MGQHSQVEQAEPDTPGFGRRRFLGYLLAAPTLAVAAQMGLETAEPALASAAIPSPPQPSDEVDLLDVLLASVKPTENLIAVQINSDGSASFAMPRLDSGTGTLTSSAMLIAEELDLPVEKVHVTQADARPELVLNQFTAGSNTTFTTHTPIRVAAAIAREQLIKAAAIELGTTAKYLVAKGGNIVTSSGASAIPFGKLAQKAASQSTKKVSAKLKDPSEFTVIGTSHSRTDRRDAVTGKKKYTLDHTEVKDAKPAMICRAPTINGTVQKVHNAGEVEKMSGISDVVSIPTGVAVRGETFGQCIDAVRALKVSWGKGTVDGESDETIHKKLKDAEVPLAVPKTPLAKTIDLDLTFYWKSNSALEPQTAIADVHSDHAEVWSAMQSPILTQSAVAKELGLKVHQVTAHVTNAGGAFGRRMFSNVVVEAAQISKKTGKPVKLMWDRTAEFRFGRMHPMCTSRVRATHKGGNVLTLEQRHTSVATDYTQGFGDAITAEAAMLPEQNFLEYSTTVFETTANVPYNFGATTQLLNEILDYDTFHTGSVRNLYMPDVNTAIELMVDRLATAMGQDRYEFRKKFIKDDRSKAVIEKAAKAGNWGRSLPKGVAQGLGFHKEYKGVNAVLAEVDARPQTVHRKATGDRRVADGKHDHTAFGPRVTKLVMAVDVGLPINPRGLQAQMEGGMMSAIGQVFTESAHLKDGNFAEGSWDQYFYTREWNVPPEVQVIVMPPTTGVPGGAGEFGVAAAKAAAANAYAAATGKTPTHFPINHNDDLGFEPYPRTPSLPQSPTDGLDYAY
jgi:isoquinoline 1-oxidoreductase beta subunit